MKQPVPPDRDELKRIVEAILFAHDGPMTAQMLIDVVPEVDAATIRSVMDELDREYRESERSFEIVRVAGGYQVCTRECWSTWVARFQRGKRRVRLSRAAVETLGIVAFRQPVTRGEIEDIRGVDTGGVIHTLLERDLVAVKGRAKTVGRPLLYVTTIVFLEYFGLDTLDDLPHLEEIEELIKESAEIMEEIEAEAGPPPEVDEEGSGVIEPVRSGESETEPIDTPEVLPSLDSRDVEPGSLLVPPVAIVRDPAAQPKSLESPAEPNAPAKSLRSDRPEAPEETASAGESPSGGSI